MSCQWGSAINLEAHHLAGSKNERRTLRLPYPHDHRGKAFGIVLRIPCVQGYCLQVQLALQIHSGHHVLWIQTGYVLDRLHRALKQRTSNKGDPQCT